MSGVSATAAVASRLRGVIGEAGNVYDMLGNPTAEKDFKTRYVNGAKIHAYEVTREASGGEDGTTTGASSRTELIAIYGFYGFQDGISEPIFQAEIDAICAAFDPVSDRRFDGTDQADLFDWSGPLQVDGPKMGKLGNALVHYVRMTYPIQFFPIT